MNRWGKTEAVGTLVLCAWAIGVGARRAWGWLWAEV